VIMQLIILMYFDKVILIEIIVLNIDYGFSCSSVKRPPLNNDHLSTKTDQNPAQLKLHEIYIHVEFWTNGHVWGPNGAHYSQI